MEGNTATSTQVDLVCAVLRCQIPVCALILIAFCLLSSAEWSQRDLERNENVKFCRQYIVFHDDKSVVYSGASGNCTEIKGEYVKHFVILSGVGVEDVLVSRTLSKLNSVSSTCFSCQIAE